MSFTDSLFRSSFWSYETHDVTLRRLSELYTPPPEPAEPEAALPVTAEVEQQSRFSISSDDDDDDDDDGPGSSQSSNPIVAPLSLGLQRIMYRDKALPPVPRSYSLARQQRRQMSVRSSGLGNIDEISWPMPPGMVPPAKPPPSTPLPPLPVKSDDKADEMSRTRSFLYVSTVCMAQLCAQAGIGQTLAILREIGTSFDVSNPGDLVWVLAGYSLAIGTFVLIAGRLGDTYGYKRIFLIGFVWSSIFSTISGVAVYSTHALFVASRVFHGMGAALSLPNGLALLAVTYPPGKKKSMVFTLVATMAPIGIIIGAASASLFALAWWPITYWTFAVTLVTIAVIGHFVIPDSTLKTEVPANFRAAISELDIPGAITGVTALVLISFAWNQAPIVGWQEPYLWIALIVGILLATLFVLIENYYAAKPLIPFYALSPDVSFILVVGACGWSCFGIWASYTWQFLENIRGVPPLLATAYISPCIIVGCCATMSTGLVLQRLGPSIVVFVSLLGFTLGAVLVATMPAVQIYWAQLFFSVLIVSWAMDTSYPAATLALSNAVESKHQGAAASLASTVMNYSISIGLGIARTVESYVNRGEPSLENKLEGYRAALFTAVSLAGLGAIICTAFLLREYLKIGYLKRRKRCCTCHGVVEGSQI